MWFGSDINVNISPQKHINMKKHTMFCYTIDIVLFDINPFYCINGHNPSYTSSQIGCDMVIKNVSMK